MLVYYLFVFILGLLIGSFLNVCIYRIPQQQSIVMPPSHCTSCGSALKPLDLVPVLSYLFLKGKCRYCGTKVSPRYMMVELLTGVMFSLLFYRYSLSFDFIAYAFFMSILIAVFFIDIDYKIIPDELVITGLAVGIIVIVYNMVNPMQIYRSTAWWDPVVGIFVGSGFLFLVAVLGIIVYKSDEVMGMGDVKIFAPIGILLGWKMCLVALFLSIISGGVFSLFLMIISTKNRKQTIPLGPFIVTGTFATLLWGWDILAWYIKTIV